MPGYLDGKKITALYWGGRKIREAWYGGERVFSGKPVEVMPATPGKYDARDWLRRKLTEYGEDYQTVTEIPFDIDSSQATNMYSMFYYCEALTRVPDMDTSQATNMRHMFQHCESLTDGNVRLIGKHPNVDTGFMIFGSGLTREPFYDKSGQPI